MTPLYRAFVRHASAMPFTAAGLRFIAHGASAG
jgi:hypothetical protein